jgi:hypothetical protein
MGRQSVIKRSVVMVAGSGSSDLHRNRIHGIRLVQSTTMFDARRVDVGFVETTLLLFALLSA